MTTYPQQLMEVFQWLIRSSFHATILLCIILIIRSIVQNQFRYRIVFWLWMLLLIRLIWPLNIQTAFSVFNLIPPQAEPVQYLSTPAAEEQSAHITPNGESTAPSREIALESSANTADQSLPAEQTDHTGSLSITFTWPQALCTLWLTGSIMITAYVLISNFRLWRIIKSRRLVTRQDILDLLEDCKARLDLQTVIGVVETGRVKSPCLFGYLRPRLLLPAGALDELSPEQLRYVFLHELAHLKRHDILVGWLMALVQILHWFNPAVWYAMTQIERDRELACDELTLSCLGENEPKAYGSTILTFLERFSQRRRLPGVAGIAESKTLIKRRMSMIAKFKNRKIPWIPALALMMILAATTFTSARSMVTSGSVETAPNPAPTVAQPPSAPAPAPTAAPRAASSTPDILAQDDGKSAGQKSIAGSGHAVFFETAQSSELVALMLYGSRYGASQPPKENFHIWLCGMDQKVIKDFEFPYGTFKKGDPKWVKLRVEATELPERFYLCAGFDPEQTKGVFIHYDNSASGNSYTGLPEQGFAEFEDGDWMIRAVVRPLAEKTSTLVTSTLTEVQAPGLQGMIDAAQPGSTLEIPPGTYEQPVTISKSLILKGTDREKCIIKVTANEPAIMIDTAGKGKVIVENLTIQWQLATSDQAEFPFAVAVKDTQATVQNCTFIPMGNFERSPVGIRSAGFSKMNVQDCDFTGFDYVVCFGEGTTGTMSGCFIKNCGHQGVILYSGAEAEVSQNIITGSGYHAVRTTGGKLDMHDNLIVNNKNRGVYLGNKSGSGRIVNNLLIGNATGIDGMSACRFAVENNVILKSTYAAISARPYAMLMIRGNVFSGNLRGIIVHQEEGKSDPVQSKIGPNVFWKNQTDLENCECPEALAQEPDFIEPGTGNFSLADPAFENMGLKNPKAIYNLWQKYVEKK